MKFHIEQIALCPPNPILAKSLLEKMGALEWTDDEVTASGSVSGFTRVRTNTANLSFNYELLDSANELEILHYESGDNWMAGSGPRVSHLGMHVSEAELSWWREFFAKEKITVAQEVWTDSHTNPAIRDSRRYHYCIFDTYGILGVDIKFIVRKDITPFVEPMDKTVEAYD